MIRRGVGLDVTPRFIAKQLSWPTGIGGWLVRAGMNRGNARLNTYAVDQLHLAPEDRVVEVGFGSGTVLPRLLEGAVFVCGVDRSESVVNAAARRFVDAVNAGRAEFRVGTVESLPLPDATFDKALSIHISGKALKLGPRNSGVCSSQAGESCLASFRRCIRIG
ncbi:MULTISPECIES: class I SAM-dependent methyltransferase [unclassified Mesorhizobium]|uniref:class I SAM-dependent methyltransferase n=1 Tax=unclassified Mesorhizobium TaxID=325217 RepID=UPI00112AC5DB|nr:MULTISPECIES: class I SAM-dependent methyltransferase [unclassified Mesorhizobium]TPN57315.1 class I SAM-dependent methyltransferase [Mesorhizobium sp. B1-1-7]TPN57739.1 class I SAM-dependent methyltransferase [Mesorhizobium sp. B1-1-9]